MLRTANSKIKTPKNRTGYSLSVTAIPIQLTGAFAPIKWFENNIDRYGK